MKTISKNQHFLIIVFVTIVSMVFALVKPLKVFSSPKQQFSVADGNIDTRCGPKALLVICRILGVETNLEELIKLSDFNNSGTTMYGLLQAARKKRVSAVGLEISLEELSQLDKPCIAFVNSNHFVAIVDYKDGIFNIVDSDRLYTIQKSELEEIYSGKVLVISKDGILTENSFPSIHFQEYKHDFGPLEQNQTIEYTFTFYNKGKTKLIIDKVKTGCSCLATLISKKELPGGDKGQISVKFNTGGQEGTTQQHLLIHTNDPNNAWVKLILSYTIKAEINVSPKHLDLGHVYPNDLSERKITISFPTNNDSKIMTVTSDCPDVLVGQIAPAKTISNNRIFEIPIKLANNKSIGQLEGIISIQTTDSQKPYINIPVRGEVIGLIKIWPNQFFWGIVEQGQQAKAKVRVFQQNLNKPNWKIEKLETAPGCPVKSYEITKNKGGREYEIELTLFSAKPGLVKDTVRIYTNNVQQPILEVPAIGLIKNEKP